MLIGSTQAFSAGAALFFGESDRRRQLQAFHRRQHRYRRRDHAVAEKQRGADQSQRQRHSQHATRDLVATHLARECHQRHDAAFAMVVRPHDEGHVLARHHDDQRPEH
jgi:hypothetical protein